MYLFNKLIGYLIYSVLTNVLGIREIVGNMTWNDYLHFVYHLAGKTDVEQVIIRLMSVVKKSRMLSKYMSGKVRKGFPSEVTFISAWKDEEQFAGAKGW